VVIPEPTFTLYRLMTEVNGGDPVPVPLTPELCFDVEAIVAAAADASVIVLCTPNNPTGSALTREEIVRIHDGTRALVVLDQAYVEFGGYDAIELLAERPRLLVLRTFSKAVALAGLRAGYLLGHPALVEQINKGKLPYNVNFFTEAVAAEVLRHRDLFRPQVAEIRAGRDLLYRELGAMPGIRAYPSEANFVLFRVEAEGLDHRAVFDRLLGEHGVLVRDVSKYPMLAGCLRVNAGTPQENDAFLTALREILQEAPR
jgi:histidinol-phosphate aminotransferase